MYSSTRDYYRPRSRQYNKKKRINRKFSPALYKHAIPTYYQQKGRIIQSSVSWIPEVPSSLPNQQTLDKMYQALVKSNYPGLQPSSIQYNGWYATSHTINLSEFFTFSSSTSQLSDTILDSTWLKSYVTDYVQRPPLPDGYEIFAEVPTIYYDCPSGTNTSLFSLNWIHPSFMSAITLISKSTRIDLTEGKENFVLHVSPHDPNRALIYRLTFSSSSVNAEHYIEGTRNPISTSVPYIPIVSTDYSSDTSYVRVSRSTTNFDSLIGTITLFIIYYYRQSQ